MDKSPLPEVDSVQKVVEKFPICIRCGNILETIKYLDYGDIRVIFHEQKGCVIGVLSAPMPANSA